LPHGIANLPNAPETHRFGNLAYLWRRTSNKKQTAWTAMRLNLAASACKASVSPLLRMICHEHRFLRDIELSGDLNGEQRAKLLDIVERCPSAARRSTRCKSSWGFRRALPQPELT
jgi:hypothetical protein